MKKKSIIAMLITLCLLTGCSINSEEQSNDNTEKITTGSAVNTTEQVTEKNTEGGSEQPEITDVTEREKKILFYRDDLKIDGRMYLPDGDGHFWQ